MSVKIFPSALIVTAAVASMFSMNANAATQVGNGKYSLGFQTGFASAGIAARVGLNEQASVEAVLGLFGTLTHIGARVLYTFKDETQWQAYGFGAVGLWMWDSGSPWVSDESAVGLGGGVGVEWDWRTLDPELPPMTWNVELGLGSAKFDNYDFSTTSLGVGFRYHF